MLSRSTLHVFAALLAFITLVTAQTATSSSTVAPSATSIPGGIVIPTQGLSRSSGYPAWHGLREDWDLQTLDAVTLWSVIGSGFGAFISLRYGHLFADHSHLDKSQRGSRNLTTIIAWYTIVTFFSVVSFFILDISKLWSSFGAIHNLVEVSILLVMLFKGHVKGFRYLYSLQFLYILFTVVVCLILPWPYDAVFFKFQGLATDFALVFEFVRLYRVNKSTEYHTPGPRRGESASLLPNSGENGHVVEEEEIEEEPHQLETENVKILIAAATIHVLGNCATTLSDEFWAYVFILAFSLCLAGILLTL
ncbi:hypothetical protein BC936DRAFT_139796 [Jimgerdemannia flammicorona]|uniref:Uncharacterized protein n=1 Tax=Jimgerdemannia flammicorona TaxID=994334 RepID=A0A433B992_9FUNG|nr:hypothetical protein BC936DRAFT_139796 [Jimgerdemannia flammicorona]